MATRMAAPKLSPLALASETADERRAYDDTTRELLSGLAVSPEQSWRDEMLAFSSGMRENPNTGATGFGGALSNAFGTQLAQRNKARELQSQYIPNILNFVQQERAAQLEARRAQQEMEMFYGPGGMGGAMGGASPMGSPASVGGGAGVPMQPGQATAGISGLPQGAGGLFGRISQETGIPLPAIAMLHKAGKLDKVGELVADRSKPQWTVQDGFRVNANPNSMGGDAPVQMIMPKVTTDAASGNTSILRQGADGQFEVVEPKGARRIASERGDEEQQRKDDSQLVQITGPNGEQRMITLGMAKQQGLISGGTPAAPSAPARVPSANAAERAMAEQVRVDMGGTPESARREIAAIERDLKSKEIDPASRKMLEDQRDLLQGQLSRMGSQQQVTQAPPQPTAQQGAGLKTGLSPAEVQTNENIKLANEDFMKNVLPPIREEASTARGRIESINGARKAMEAMGGTGWGTDKKEWAAAVLGALGSEDAKKYASNAQIFQAEAKKQLAQILATQKGPQTDKDMAMLEQTGQRLTGTTRYNTFIFDVAEAQAQRAIMKDRFFREMMPKSREDYTAIDRMWSQRAPSIFTMPSMKKWEMNSGKNP